MYFVTVQVAMEVINLYSNALRVKRPNAWVDFRNIEQTINKKDGSRFLLEMDIHLKQPRKRTIHTSEYVYLRMGSSQLCHTANFQWTKRAFVHLVVAGNPSCGDGEILPPSSILSFLCCSRHVVGMS
jgi:hypothetical protein